MFDIYHRSTTQVTNPSLSNIHSPQRARSNYLVDCTLATLIERYAARFLTIAPTTPEGRTQRSILMCEIENVLR